MSESAGLVSQVIERGEFEFSGSILTFIAELENLSELDGLAIAVEGGNLIIAVDVQKLAVSFGVDEDTVKQILIALNLLEIV